MSIRSFWFGIGTALLVILTNITPVNAWTSMLQVNDVGVSDATFPQLPITAIVDRSWVRLDGYNLFQVASVEGITAVDRAGEISQRLQSYGTRVQTTDEAATVQWRQDDNTRQPVIYTGDQFLMTVTDADAVLVGVSSSQVRAAELVDQLVAALERYGYERQPGVIQQRWWWAGGLLLLMMATSWGLLRLHRWLSHVPLKNEAKDEAAAQSLGRRIIIKQAQRIYEVKHWLFWLGELFIWFGGSFTLLGLFPVTRVWQQPLLILSRVPLRIAIALALSYAIIRLGDVVIDRLFFSLYGQVRPGTPRTQRANLRFSTFSQVAKSILVAVVLTVGSLAILSIIGINLAPLLASAGIVGLALSLASQSLLKDIINGFMILMEDHYGIGDVIIVGDVSGFVETMNLRITQLRNEEGRLITIPNGQIGIVQNLSKEWSRVDLQVPVALDNDIDQALMLIRHVADEMQTDPVWQSTILDTPLLLGVDKIDHIGATVRLWIKTLPLKQWDVAREYRRRLKIAFEEANLTFGIPQQTLHFVPRQPSLTDAE